MTDLGDNSVRLIGGSGHDLASLLYSSVTDDLAFDFSHGYDQVLADGTVLRGFERVSVSAGDGDDLFRGGSGDDSFYGGLGSDYARGGAGDDVLAARGILYNFEESITRSHDSDVLLGEAGNDTLTADLSEQVYFGSTLVSENTVFMSGGRDDDDLSSTLSAFAQGVSESAPANATTRDNTLTMTGDKGKDSLAAHLSASSHFGATTTVTDNTLLLNRAKGDDDLSVDLFTSVEEMGMTIMTGNQITLLGGKGDDRLHVSGNAMAGNCLILDGGRGHDTLAFEGDRGDYHVTETGKGDYEVTDLGDGSPGAVYSILDVETLVFNGTVFDLA
ncbi:hypothetical protein [Rubellimicrobium mesophilum]|uniref:hypothetical protein n=1 Tax=Rubellimicrobium mesophilum TaxID=1123067 RepID=UPI0012E124B4|nr:hypothetical protein [Rubellimicrobium mesophilum]